MPKTLLIIEDETLLGTELARHYNRQGWEVQLVASLSEARAVFTEQVLDPQVILADMSLPDGNSLDLLEELRQQKISGEWIFLTGYGGVPDSVRALRLGAFDFLEKPCETARLDVVVNGAERSAKAQRRLQNNANVASRRYNPESYIGHSAAVKKVHELLHKLTAVPFSALIIQGETGTGKGLVAKILHHAGTRAEGPLIEVNCAALPKELMEAELFGHEAGAFTGARGRRRGLFEQADGGTLFLDEIGELPLDLQTKLLKAIEDRTIRRIGGEREIHVDVQILAASNRNLPEAVQSGEFRSDLYHRLCVFSLVLPALRERKDDLRNLVPAFVQEFNVTANKKVREIPEAVWKQLSAHHWPGNVRELRNVVERCVLFSDGEEFPEQWLQLQNAPILSSSDTAQGARLQGDMIQIPLDGSMALEEMDRFIIKTALEQHQYNVTATARALGSTRETLRYRIQKYELTAPEEA